MNAYIYAKSQRQQIHKSKLCKIQSESSNVNSIVINTNDAIKGKSDESSKIEQIGMDQTLKMKKQMVKTYPSTRFQGLPYSKNKALNKQKNKISQ